MIDAGLYRRLFAELAAIGRTDAGWQRLAWGPGEDAARAWFARDRRVARPGRGAGPGGQPLGGRARRRRGRAWIATGSHVDTVAGGGAFDGALGVVAGLVAVEAVRRGTARAPTKGRVPTNFLVGPCALAVGCMVDEEGPRFGTRDLRLPGPRAASSIPTTCSSRSDADGCALGDLAAARGVTAESLRAAPAFRARLAAWIEVHVEQGRRLADVPAALGVATGLAPRERWRLRLERRGRPRRHDADGRPRDALVAAAAGRSRPPRRRDASRARWPRSATLGVEPGSSNVIPGAAS